MIIIDLWLFLWLSLVAGKHITYSIFGENINYFKLLCKRKKKIFTDGVHFLSLWDVAAGTVINILLINDVLLHPFASHLLLIGTFLMTRWTAMCSLTHTVTRSSLSPPLWLRSRAICALEFTCWCDKRDAMIYHWGRVNTRAALDVSGPEWMSSIL